MNILVSGLLNMETTAAVRSFPVEYYPIDYPFFGVNSTASGVAFNLSKALTTLGDRVRLCAMVGNDFPAEYIRSRLASLDIGTEHVLPALRQTPASVVLHDPWGRRQIYCDLKDIQETPYPFSPELLESIDLVAACNINFNRPLLSLAKAAGKTIATDVHVLGDVWDGYNREFIEAADILFLSDEAIGEDYRGFLYALAGSCRCGMIVLGRGAKGAALYLRQDGSITELPVRQAGTPVNTVGAGDALFSAFLHYYAGGFSPLEALDRAQLFAACKITANGGAEGFVSPETIEQLL